MARQARLKSETDIYHVMLRGINKQQIFFDEEDYKKFIHVLIECKRISKFELYAYCLMDNHIHLLIKDSSHLKNDENCHEDISTIIKRIGCRFVYWYNCKYNRVGHLFQDRFRSEPVLTDDYFLCVLRYIHKNPVEAGIVKNCIDYPYSSYSWYFENGILVDKNTALQMMSLGQFAEFHQGKDTNSFIDIVADRTKLTDEIAEKIILDLCNIQSLSDFKNFDRKEQNKLLAKLKKHGVSGRQLIRIIGVTQYQAEHAG